MASQTIASKIKNLYASRFEIKLTNKDAKDLTTQFLEEMRKILEAQKKKSVSKI